MTQLDPELGTRIVGEALRRGERIKRRRRALGVSFGAAGAAAAAVVGLVLTSAHPVRSEVLVNPSAPTTASKRTTNPSTATVTGRTTKTTPGTSTPSPSACHASDLSSTVLAVGAATGHILVRVTLTAQPGVSCRLDGYAQVTPLDAQGQPVSENDALGHTAVLSSTPLTPGRPDYIILRPPAPTNVHITPGLPAHFDFTYDDNPAGTQTSCPDVTELKIKLPGTSHPIAAKATPALGSVCDSFQVAAILPGAA